MDFGSTLSRALKVVRENKALWLLGFLAALGGATNALGSTWRFDSRDLASGTFLPSDAALPNWMMRPGAMAVGIGMLVLLAFVLSVALYVVGMIARGGLIKGVQLIEDEGTTSFRAAWSAGASRFWSLLGLTLLLFLPFILIGVIAVVVLITSGAAIFAPAISGNSMSQNSMVTGGIAIGVLALAMGCAAIAYGLVALGLQTLGERAIMLDNLPVMEALRKARTLFRAQLGNIILMALVVFLIDVTVSIVTGVVTVLLFVPTLATLLANQAMDATTVVLAAVGFVAALLIGALISSVFNAFISTVWTLTYRQFNGSTSTLQTNTPAPLTHPA